MFWLDGAEVWAGAGAGAKDVGITCMGGNGGVFALESRSEYVRRLETHQVRVALLSVGDAE